MSIYKHIAQQAGQVPVLRLYQALRVALAAYYVWQRRQQLPLVESAWQLATRETFAYHSQRYRTRRLRSEVQA